MPEDLWEPNKSLKQIEKENKNRMLEGTKQYLFWKRNLLIKKSSATFEQL